MAERVLSLVAETSAMGVGYLVVGVSGRFGSRVHLQQPLNDWAREHVDEEYHARQRDALLRMLYDVYRAGREDMRAEFRDLLEAKPTPKPYGVALPESGENG